VKKEMLKERVELLAIGEVLGYPRLGIGQSNGNKHAIRAGQVEWEKFAGHAHTTRIPAALRIGRILRDYGIIPFNPRVDALKAAPVAVELPEESVSGELAARPHYVIQLDEPMPELIMVKPKRSSAAIRQARWREKRKAANA
jgi:hypothetical protein